LVSSDVLEGIRRILKRNEGASAPGPSPAEVAAKEQAEAEAKHKAETEAKAKAEAEAQARLQAEASLRAKDVAAQQEAEARARSEAASKLAAELEKARLEAEMDRMRRELEALRSRGSIPPTTPASIGSASDALADAPRFDGVTMREMVADSGQARAYRAEFRGEEVAARVFHLTESAVKQYREELASLLCVCRVQRSSGLQRNSRCMIQRSVASARAGCAHDL
jgi:fused signal recognition particle receptor